LRKMIADYKFAPGENLNIIAHSHGGNIALAASHLGLSHQIDNLITLGTPNLSDQTQYEPAAGGIGNSYNITASMDFVQSSAGDDVSNRFIQPGASNHTVNSVTWNPIQAHSELWQNQSVRNQWWQFFMSQQSQQQQQPAQQNCVTNTCHGIVP
jgi:hypothetical protein